MDWLTKRPDASQSYKALQGVIKHHNNGHYYTAAVAFCPAEESDDPKEDVWINLASRSQCDVICWKELDEPPNEKELEICS